MRITFGPLVIQTDNTVTVRHIVEVLPIEVHVIVEDFVDQTQAKIVWSEPQDTQQEEQL